MNPAFLLAALAGTGLLLAHAARSRGARSALVLAAAALVFGIARPNAVHWITVGLAGAKPPYEFPEGTIRLLHGALFESLGWLFAASLAIALGIRLAARTGKPGHVPSETAWSALVLAAVSYAVESVAGPAGLWRWNVSVVNRFFHDVPGVAVLDWLTVGPDLVLPLLLLGPGRPALGRARWLALLVFPAHMAAHAADVLDWPLSGVTPSRLWHAAVLIGCAAAPFVAPRLVRPGAARAASEDRSFLPELAAIVLLGITAWVHLAIVLDPRAAVVTALPLAILAFASRVLVPAMLAAGLGVVAIACGSWYAPNAIPLLFLALSRGRALATKWVAIAAGGLLAGAALLIAVIDARHRKAVDAVRRSDAAFALEDHARALSELEGALEIEPRNAFALHKQGLVLFAMRRVPEAKRSLERAMAEAPTDANLLWSTSIVYEATGESAAAEALIRRAARLRPLHTALQSTLKKFDQ